MQEHSSIPLVVLVLATSLFSIKLFNVAISDYLLIVMIIYFAVVSGVYIGAEFYMLLTFLCIAGLIYAVNGDFSGVLSYLKVILYAILFVTIKPFLAKQPGPVLLRSLHNAWRFFSLISLSIVLLFFVGFDSLFNVIEADGSNRYVPGIAVYKVSFVDIYRFNGYMEEPSWFALWAALLVALIFFYERMYGRVFFKKIDFLILACIYALTFSFTALAFFASLMLFKAWSQGAFKKVTYITASLALIGLMLATSDYLRTRVKLISSGQDGSFTTRFVDTFLNGFFVYRDSSYLGVGIGNVADSLDEYQNVSLQNVPMEILAATGIVGLIVFISFFFFRLVLLRRYFFVIILLMAMFVSSVIYTPVFWVFLALMCIPLASPQNLERARSSSQS